LANFGILPLEFTDPGDYDRIAPADVLALDNLHEAIRSGAIEVRNNTRDETYRVVHRLSPRQVDMVLAGGVIPLLASQQ
jgi:aconitate hydratase